MANNNDKDFQTESFVSRMMRLLHLAKHTSVQQFPIVAQNELRGVKPDELEHPGPSGFRTTFDLAMSKLSTPVNVKSINANIHSFMRKTPTGQVTARPVDRIGNHRSTVPLSNGTDSSSARVGANYTLEKADPNHRMADIIELFELQKPQGLGLHEWLSSLSYFEVCNLMRRLNKDHEFIRQYALPFMRGVKYLDAASRISYRVDFQNGVLHWANRQLDTTIQNLQTAFSGIGWGIWVLSPDGDFYTGSHKVGEFHHSSFLSGEPVKAAGEWQVNNGQIRYITGKTGHYRCDVNALLLALRQLAGMKALDASAEVIIWEDRRRVLVPAFTFMKDVALQDRCRATGPKLPGTTMSGASNLLNNAPRIGGHRGASQQVIPSTGNRAHQQNTHQNFYQPENDDYQTD